MNKLADDADELLQSLIGINSVKNQESSANLNNQEEVYQLPLRGNPKIVGRFAPGVYLNPTHPTGHNGCDLVGDRGTSIYPILSGKVIESGISPKGGNYLKIAHLQGKIVSYYAHLDSIAVREGQTVSQKTVIGGVGDSGNAKNRGTHLHFEIKINGSLVDPLKLIGAAAKIAEASWAEDLLKLANQFYQFTI